MTISADDLLEVYLANQKKQHYRLRLNKMIEKTKNLWSWNIKN
jgi:hypothetical protein